MIDTDVTLNFCSPSPGIVTSLYELHSRTRKEATDNQSINQSINQSNKQTNKQTNKQASKQTNNSLTTWLTNIFFTYKQTCSTIYRLVCCLKSNMLCMLR